MRSISVGFRHRRTCFVIGSHCTRFIFEPRAFMTAPARKFELMKVLVARGLARCNVYENGASVKNWAFNARLGKFRIVCGRASNCFVILLAQSFPQSTRFPPSDVYI